MVRITLITPGEESGSSPPSATVLADGAHALDVSQIPLGPAGTTDRKIYLNRADGSNWYLAGTLNNNTATTFSLNVPDADLIPITAPGLTTFTVANLQLIKVINPDGKTIWQYSGGGSTVPTAILPLLLLGD